ncbi:MAG: 30S ribosomal protein S19 [Candidatus Altarchaeaceae archaeon]
MARIFTYKGKTIDELKALSIDELIKIFPARIRRTLKRGLNEENRKLLLKIRKTLANPTTRNKVIRTHCRDMVILPEMVSAKIGVHKGGVIKNGDAFTIINITPEMIGHYLGEFALTRKPVKHSAAGIGATRSSKFTAQRK